MTTRGEADRWRPGLHLTPPQGWMNDPNGLCYFKGFYHVFFQYSPDYPKSAKRCWGHYISLDLVHWDFAGVALAPDAPFDRDGVYSGSALIHEGYLHLFYTGNVKHRGEYDYIHDGRESNTVHVSSKDGFSLSPKTVVLNQEQYPHTCTCHVRDPKVRKQDGQFEMVLGARLTNDQGAVLCYRGDDLQSWSLQNVMTTKEPFGYMWECPDLFTLGEVTVLSCSPQGVPGQAERNQNVDTAGYFRLPGSNVKRLEPNFRQWDYGFDFYAPQTFETPDGRRILLGWMGLPDGNGNFENPSDRYGWVHALTLLRELHVGENGIIRQYPIAEYETLRRKKWELPAGATLSFPLPFDFVGVMQDSDFRIVLEQELVLSFSQKERLFTMEFLGTLGGGRTKRLAHVDCVESLRIVADHSAIEVYLNEGEVVMTTRFYPESDTVTIALQGISAMLYPMQNLEVNLHETKPDLHRGSAD